MTQNDAVQLAGRMKGNGIAGQAHCGTIGDKDFEEIDFRHIYPEELLSGTESKVLVTTATLRAPTTGSTKLEEVAIRNGWKKTRMRKWFRQTRSDGEVGTLFGPIRHRLAR